MSDSILSYSSHNSQHGYSQHELESLQPEKGNYGRDYNSSGGSYSSNGNYYKQYLTRSRKGKYHCPVCNGSNFSIGSNGYTCFSNGCSGKDIHITLLKLSGEWVEPGQQRDWLSKDEWLKQRSSRETEAKAINQANNARSKVERGKAKPSDIELDKVYREFLNGLTLDPDHAAAISNRGFSLELALELMYRTIPNAKALLPLNPLGRFSLKCGRALVLPVIRNGLIVGCQVRPDDSSKGKYIWLTNGGIHRQNGELPSALFRSTIETSQELNVVEGIGFKGALAHQRLKTWTWAIPGCDFGSYEESFKEAIALSKALTVILNADSGSLLNKNVYKGYKELYELCVKYGVQFKIRWWGQVEKDKGSTTLGDIDEIDDQTLTRARLIDWEQFEQLRRTIGDKKAYLDRLKFTPTVVQSQRFVEFGIPSYPCITAVKTGCGTGKTTQMLKLVYQHLNETGNGSVFCTYRLSLLSQTADKLRSLGQDLGEYIAQYQLNNGYNSLTAKDEGGIVFGCINSIRKINPESLKGKILVIDEISGVLETICNSSTIRNEDVWPLIDHWGQILQAAEHVFALDANLTDNMVNLVSGMANKPVIKIENKPQNIGIKIAVHQGSVTAKNELRLSDRSKILGRIKDNLAPIIIGTDSQKQGEAIERILLNQGRKGLRIDSKTAETPEVKAFLRNPNEWILINKPDYIIYSPTIESGVDITVDYFDTHYILIKGVVSVNSALQMIMRVRSSSTPKELFVAPSNRQGIERLQRSFDPNIIQWLMTKNRVGQFNAIGDDRDTETIGDLLKTFADQQLSPWLKYANELAASNNYEKANFRKLLIERLKENLHEVTLIPLSVKDDEDKEVIVDFKERLNEVKIDEATRIFNSNPKPQDDDEDRDTMKPRTYEQQCEDKKAYLLSALPGVEDDPGWCPGFIKAALMDNPKLIPSMEMRYFLDNPEHCLLADRRQARFMARTILSDGSKLPSWRQTKLRYDRLKALKALGIDNLIEYLSQMIPNPKLEKFPDCPIKEVPIRVESTDPELLKVFEKGNEKWIVHALGIKPGIQVTSYISAVLAMVGYNFRMSERTKHTRLYSMFGTQKYLDVLPYLKTKFMKIAQPVNEPLHATSQIVDHRSGDTFECTDKNKSQLPEPIPDNQFSGDTFQNSYIYTVKVSPTDNVAQVKNTTNMVGDIEVVDSTNIVYEDDGADLWGGLGDTFECTDKKKVSSQNLYPVKNLAVTLLQIVIYIQ